MIKLTVGNSVCKVEGLSLEQFKAVRGLLSYTDSAASRFGRYGSVRRYLIDKRGGFPTGLLYLLIGYLDENQYPYTLNDQRKRPAARQGYVDGRLSFAPYPEQIDAATACLSEGRGIICAPTGVGKSVIAGLICNAMQCPTLVVVPSLELKRQLTEGLQEIFGTGAVGDQGSGRRLIVENVDALDPARPVKVDCVIIDEFHHSGAKTYRVLNKKAWADVYYKFGLTATPFRSKSEERLLLESVLSKVIYRIEYQAAVDKGYIVPMEAYYYELPTVKLSSSGNNYHAVYSELVVKNEPRNALIAQLAANLHDCGKSSLILVKQIAHGIALQDLLKRMGYTVPFAEGDNEYTRDYIRAFNRGEYPLIIGTTGVIGEGVDTKRCEYVVLAGGGKSKNQFMQNCGRGFRRFSGKESCKLIMFKDNSHKWFQTHFKACVKYLKDEYQTAPIKLDLPTD